MPFTNTWDTTFPPDTQLANQLGLDLRNFRLDAQQRMAAISGLDAAKPAFGSDAQPANWNGILFFATDTGKIYQFNNPSWTDVTTQFKSPATKIDNTTPASVSGGAVGDLQSITIPGGTLTVGSHFHIYADVNVAFGSASGTLSVRLTFGAVSVTFNVVSASGVPFDVVFDVDGVVTGASNEEFITKVISGKVSSTSGLPVATSVSNNPGAISGAITVKTTTLGTYGAGTITGNLLLMEIL